MNINQKRKINNTKFPNDINIISPLSALESRKVLYFQKINSVNDINTYGSQPIIVYKKTSKINKQNAKSPNQKESKTLKNDLKKYISNTNIGKKLQKFNSFSNMQYHHINKNLKNINSKNVKGNIALLEQENKIKEEKERKKNIKEQKLFSKTVRESNMRPIFPKNKNKQFNLTKTGFNHNKNHTENNNINININKEKKLDQENPKEMEIKKNILMNKLVENAVAIEIKKYQNINNKNNVELIKNIKKREYLEENGISTSAEDITDNDNNNSKELNNEKGRKKVTNVIPKNNNYISPED